MHDALGTGTEKVSNLVKHFRKRIENNEEMEQLKLPGINPYAGVKWDEQFLKRLSDMEKFGNADDGKMIDASIT